MSSSSVSARPLVTPRASSRRSGAGDPAGPTPPLWRWWTWLLVLAAVIAASVWFVHWSYLRPSYDPFGWLAWGKVVLRGARLNLNAAPSWKPLPFLFTLPYSLFGAVSVQMWSVTAVAGAVLMGVFGARCVYRLCGVSRGDGRLVIAAAWIAAVFAGIGELGMEGLPKLTYIANSDPLNTALVLAAVDAHLSRRYRLAYVVLFLAALGRPEVWFMIGAYGLWIFVSMPGHRLFVVGGWVLVLLCWFVPDGIWAKSFTQAGKLDLGKSTEIHGNKVIGVLARWVGLYEWPMQLTALLGVAFGVVRRDRRILGLFGFALFWVLVEIAFAYHGWSAVPRYLMESAAAMIVIAGWGIFELLSAGPELLAGRLPVRPAALVGPLIVIGLLIAFVPFARDRHYRWKVGHSTAHAFGIINRNLPKVVNLAGGRQALLRCGEIAAENKFQSQLAWATGMNVASIYFNPTLLFRVHRRMVYFSQTGSGWTVHAYNEPPSLAAACARRVDVSDS